MMNEEDVFWSWTFYSYLVEFSIYSSIMMSQIGGAW